MRHPDYLSEKDTVPSHNEDLLAAEREKDTVPSHKILANSFNVAHLTRKAKSQYNEFIRNEDLLAAEREDDIDYLANFGERPHLPETILPDDSGL